MPPRRLAVALVAVLVALLPAGSATAGVQTVRSFSFGDLVPDVRFAAADADGLRRTEVELKRTVVTHLRVRRDDKLRVRAQIKRVQPSDASYRQGLVVEAWRAPKHKPPRLVAYAVVFDRPGGVTAVRASGGTTKCPRARRTRDVGRHSLDVTMPAACLRLRGRMKLVAVTYLDSYGVAGWDRAAEDRSVLSKALRYPRKLS